MTNRLSQETSPYLLQHADNPVHWHPWDEQALSEAKSEDKPILLSIGYSACHWCHVMAHESFEDEATADVMNQYFVNVKVDREERPDIDKVYQSTLQLLTQQGGGWPLTMFLDPQTLLPFYGGTYFPKTPRYQLPGFSDLLRRIHNVFDEQREALNEQGGKVADALTQMVAVEVPAQLEDQALLAQARQQLGDQYDSQHGGFGGAPKFPMPSALDRLFRQWAASRQQGDNDKDALDMVMVSLTQMARGGIYDHLGGGFCRYATDASWMIPHFEKMLYDNAQLLPLYCDALTLGEDALFEDAVCDTIGWLQREMQHPKGGFYAALDADSEGEEGKFYVWRRDEIKKLLPANEYLLIETLYGLDKPANFEGKWNLHRYDAWRSVVERLSLERAHAESMLRSAKRKLFELRAKRVRPGLDDKVLTAWNGLTIKGLARASAQFDRPEWLAAAQQCADFLSGECWDGEQLMATWKDGQAKHPGYLDDYANLLNGLLSLLEVQWRERDIQLAIAIADALLDNFYDTEAGGFFFTAHQHEKLIVRPKPTTDDALPAGNGSAVLGLSQLGHLLGRSQYIDAAAHTLQWARGVMERYPAGHCTLLNGLEEQLMAPEQIILRGQAQLASPWIAQCRGGYQPWRHCYVIPYEQISTTPDYLPRLVSSEAQSQITGFVCRGTQCSLPLTDPEQLAAELNR